MIDLEQILDYLDPINRYEISNDEGYRDGQLGQVLPMYEEEFPDLTEVDIVIVGCPETRGSWQLFSELNPANEIRHQFYAAYYWHQDIKIADIGNVKRGAGLLDTHFALKEVLTALYDAGKTVIVLGGSHDLTLSQYKVFVDRKNIIEAVCVDALIDLNLDSSNKSEQFLMEMLTGEPNYIRHYNHIGFQSYYVHPRMLETMDKLRFDCYRVGTVKERIEEMEPVIRSCSMMSFDISAFANSFSPASRVSPNGFNGEEACTLMQYAGMSMEMKSVGVYGYIPEHDKDQLSAKQIAHMLWYFIDGRSRALREAPLTKRDSFREFQIAFGEIDALFLQSKKTGRWWMQLPDEKFIPCSYTDYLTASNNEIPERWFRAQERSA